MTPDCNFIVIVAKIPRGIGAKIGVNEIFEDLPVARVIASSISGVCWWTPPNLYEVRLPITSLAIRLIFALRPAPVVPEAATTTTSSISAIFAAGAIPRAIAVA